MCGPSFGKKRKISGQKKWFFLVFDQLLFIVENHLQFGVFSMILSFVHAHANFSWSQDDYSYGGKKSEFQ